MSPVSGEITELLHRLSQGDASAEAALLERVYPELKRLAAAHLRQERPGHTLQATALVHEAYLKLTRQKTVEWKDRAHFFAVAATIMRRVLVDYARHRLSKKRGAQPDLISVDLIPVAAAERPEALLDLDEALSLLARTRPRLAQVVEMRYFGGMTEDQIAEVLQISPRTVKRDWHEARSILHQSLEDSQK